MRGIQRFVSDSYHGELCAIDWANVSNVFSKHALILPSNDNNTTEEIDVSSPLYLKLGQTSL